MMKLKTYAFQVTSICFFKAKRLHKGVLITYATL